MQADENRMPLLTIGDLWRCARLPIWLRPLLAGRPQSQRCSVLYEELCDAERHHRAVPWWVFFWAILGLRFGPEGSLVGALLGMLSSGMVFSGDRALLRAGPGAAERFAEWLGDMGPPFIEPLGSGEWLDRRYPPTDAMPFRQAHRDSQGRLLAFEFKFRDLEFRYCEEAGQLTVAHPSGEQRTFPTRLRSWQEDVEIDLTEFFRLILKADGQRYILETDPYPAGIHYPYCMDTGLSVRSLHEARVAFPFPREWLAPPAE